MLFDCPVSTHQTHAAFSREMGSWHTTTPCNNNRHKNRLATTRIHTVTVHVNAVGLVDPLGWAQLKVSKRCFFHFNCLHVAEHSRMEAVGLFSYCKPVTTRKHIPLSLRTPKTRPLGKCISDLDAENPGYASAKAGQLVSIA
jgi:hypothetical protein